MLVKLLYLLISRGGHGRGRAEAGHLGCSKRGGCVSQTICLFSCGRISRDGHGCCTAEAGVLGVQKENFDLCHSFCVIVQHYWVVQSLVAHLPISRNSLILVGQDLQVHGVPEH